jgi:hypothetical protein
MTTGELRRLRGESDIPGNNLTQINATSARDCSGSDLPARRHGANHLNGKRPTVHGPSRATDVVASFIGGFVSLPTAIVLKPGIWFVRTTLTIALTVVALIPVRSGNVPKI